MTDSRPARKGRDALPLGAAASVVAGGATGRRRRGGILRRGCAMFGALLVVALIAGAILGWPKPLPVPEQFFPAAGVITALEVPRGASRELDAAIAALVEQLPATTAFTGTGIDLPAVALPLLSRSGPWRVALWREGGERREGLDGRVLLFIGGESFGLARSRAAREAAKRIDGREGIAAAAAGGGLLLGDDRELVRECAERAGSAERRSIPHDGVRYWRDDPERGAALELWWEPREGEEILLERWRGADGAIAWREWLLDHGVSAQPLEVDPATPGERRYRLEGAREALGEWVRELGRW